MNKLAAYLKQRWEAAMRRRTERRMKEILLPPSTFKDPRDGMREFRRIVSKDTVY